VTISQVRGDSEVISVLASAVPRSCLWGVRSLPGL
jgi:hypothetical protein